MSPPRVPVPWTFHAEWSAGLPWPDAYYATRRDAAGAVTVMLLLPVAPGRTVHVRRCVGAAELARAARAGATGVTTYLAGLRVELEQELAAELGEAPPPAAA